MLLCLTLGVGVAAAYVFDLATPTYRSSVTLMLEPQESKVIDLAVVMPALGRDAQILNTQVEVIRSRGLMGGLVDQLGLVSDPEFNVSRRTPSPYHPAGLAETTLAQVLGRDAKPVATLPLDQQREATIDAVLDALAISIESESLIIRLGMSTTDARKSARILNTLAAGYVGDQLSAKRAATEDATRWLTDRVIELKSSLETAERQARAARAQNPEATPEAVAELERRLAALRQREAAASGGGPSRTSILAEITTVEASIQNASEALIAHAQLDREARATALLYETFLSRLKETSIQTGTQRADARVLSNATISAHPASPNKPLTLAIAAILGLGLGTLWVLLREEWRVRFRTVEELEQTSTVPILATIPDLPDKRRDPLAELSRQPSSALAEAIRTLRSSVLLSNIDRPPQVITLTSSVCDEGKSTTTLLLAQTLTSWDKSVLVIEADIRAATFQQRYKMAEPRGLLSMLAGLCKVDDVLFRPPGQGFDIVPGEATAAHAADVFATGRFAQFLADMRERFNYILIDTPPVLSAADARMIGTSSDALLYLVRWNRTKRSQLRRGLSQFNRFGQPITGLVLSRAKPPRLAVYASRQR